MSLATIMLEQLAAARRVIEDGHEMVPVWRITSPEGTFLIFTRFDTDKDEQRGRAQFLISRFMVWKMATSFVFTAETWLGVEKTRSGDEALLASRRFARAALRIGASYLPALVGEPQRLLSGKGGLRTRRHADRSLRYPA